jgi:hypothetical protein
VPLSSVRKTTLARAPAQGRSRARRAAPADQWHAGQLGAAAPRRGGSTPRGRAAHTGRGHLLRLNGPSGAAGRRTWSSSPCSSSRSRSAASVSSRVHLDAATPRESGAVAREGCARRRSGSADPQRAGRALRDAAPRPARRDLRDDRVGVAERRRPASVRSTRRGRRGVDQALADDPFELGDLLAHGRLRVAKLAGRRAEGGVFRPPPARPDGAARPLHLSRSDQYESPTRLC